MMATEYADRWEERAACRSADPTIFFNTRPAHISSAKQICSRCCVQGECLARALRAESLDPRRYGVFGGLTALERRTLAGS